MEIIETHISKQLSDHDSVFFDVFLLSSMPGDPPTYDKTQFEFIVTVMEMRG